MAEKEDLIAKEIEKLDEEIKLTKRTLIFNIVKSICVGVFTVFVFVYITRPEWILRSETVKENLRREKAKLTIETLQLGKYEDVLLGLELINEAYGGDDTTFNAIRAIYTQRASETIKMLIEETPEQKEADDVLEELKKKYGN